MKVAHIIDALGWGGAQKLLLTFAETASPRGIDTLVVSLRADRHRTDIPKLLRARGAKVIELKYPKLFDPRIVPSLVYWLKKEQVDVVHTHLSHANITGSIAGKIARYPVLATLHNTRATGTGKFDFRIRAERFCLRYMTTRVIAVGEKVAEVYRPQLNKATLDVVPNSVDVGKPISDEKRKELRIEMAGNPDRTIIIAVGRLRIQKGYDDLLTAFAQLHQTHPNTFLAIVGVGTMLEALKEHTQSLGLTDHVHFLGAREDVPQLLSAADLFVNSSLFEGLSIAMLEAMAAGLPTVATRVGDAENLLSSGSGLLVEPHEPGAFANAIESMLGDPERMRAMGRIARDCVEKNYTSEIWLDKLLNSYALAQQKGLPLGKNP